MSAAKANLTLCLSLSRLVGHDERIASVEEQRRHARLEVLSTNDVELEQEVCARSSSTCVHPRHRARSNPCPRRQRRARPRSFWVWPLASEGPVLAGDFAKLYAAACRRGARRLRGRSSAEAVEEHAYGLEQVGARHHRDEGRVQRRRGLQSFAIATLLAGGGGGLSCDATLVMRASPAG
jgi:hypothetical protein